MKAKIDKFTRYQEIILNAQVRNSKRTLKIINRLLEKDPSNTDLLDFKSYELQGRGRLSESLETAEYCLQLDPTNYYAYRQIGELHHIMGHYKKSRENYQKGLEILRDLKARKVKEYFKGQLDFLIKDFQEALDKVIAREPFNSRFKPTRKLSKAEHKKRRENLRVTMSKPYEIRYRIWDLEDKGKYAEAMKLATKIMQLYNLLPHGFMEAGDLYKKMKKYEKAYEYYQTAITKIKMAKTARWEQHYDGEFDDLIRDIREEIAEIPAGKLKAIRKKFKPAGQMQNRKS